MFIVKFVMIVLATALTYFLHPFIDTQLGSKMSLLLCVFLAASISALGTPMMKLLLPNTKKRKSSHPAKPVDGPKRRGNVKWFNAKKQYGFITCDEGEDIFVHKRFIQGDKRQRIREGMLVEFSVSETEKGLQAENVEILD